MLSRQREKRLAPPPRQDTGNGWREKKKWKKKKKQTSLYDAIAQECGCGEKGKQVIRTAWTVRSTQALGFHKTPDDDSPSDRVCNVM